MRALRNDRGSVTAEFVIMLPAVMVVLGLIVGSVLLVTQRLVLTSAANDVARFEARGASQSGVDRLALLPTGIEVHRRSSNGVLCVTLSAHSSSGMMSAFAVEGMGCAAVSGNDEETTAGAARSGH